SIDGLSGAVTGGRTSDWFFYVNGIESPVGSTSYDLSGGDRIWWDYRDWTAAMRVPAVVGAWPQPLVPGFQGHRWTYHLNCLLRSACPAIASHLASTGGSQSGPTPDAIEVEAGVWSEIRKLPDVGLLASGPDRSGVFAHFVGDRRPLL